MEGLNLVDLYEQTQIVASAACRVSRQSFHSWIAGWLATCFLTFYCDPYFLFKFLFISSLFTFYSTIETHLSVLRLETSHL